MRIGEEKERERRLWNETTRFRSWGESEIASAVGSGHAPGMAGDGVRVAGGLGGFDIEGQEVMVVRGRKQLQRVFNGIHNTFQFSHHITTFYRGNLTVQLCARRLLFTF